MTFTRNIFIALYFIIAVSGCATPFRAPSDVADIKLERRDSPIVKVDKIWLERAQGALVVKGYVVGRLTATDTTQTHLKVTLYDESNQVLRTTDAEFTPRQIPGLLRPQIPSQRIRQSYASYSVALDPLPSGTARIEVRTYEGPHDTDGSPTSRYRSPFHLTLQMITVPIKSDWYHFGCGAAGTTPLGFHLI